MRRARRLLAVLGALAISAAAPAGAQTVPPPAPPLPEIGRTHSRGLCMTVRDRIAPAVLGLMKTDELIAAGHRALLKSGQDQIQATGTGASPGAGPNGALELDHVYLEHVVQAMAHNLQIIKVALSDPKMFPKSAATDDERYALLLKSQLQDAADRQNDALNRINGVLESLGMNTMRHDVSTPLQSSVGPVNPMGNPGVGFFDSSSLPGSGPLGLGGTSGVGPPNTTGHTIWNELARDVEVEQTRIAHAEQTLTPTVVAIAVGCRDELATPAPAPSSSP